jgi:hypothetical protein
MKLNQNQQELVNEIEATSSRVYLRGVKGEIFCSILDYIDELEISQETKNKIQSMRSTIAWAGDITKKQLDLFYSNIHLIDMAVNQTKYDKEGAQSIAYENLLRAVINYKVDSEMKLSTLFFQYFNQIMTNEKKRYYAKLGSSYYTMEKLRDDYNQAIQRANANTDPQAQEEIERHIADAINRLNEQSLLPVVSLDSVAKEIEDDKTLENVIACPSDEKDIEYNLLKNTLKSQLNVRCNKVFDCLEQGLTYEDISVELDIPADEVKQIVEEIIQPTAIEIVG